LIARRARPFAPLTEALISALAESAVALRSFALAFELGLGRRLLGPGEILGVGRSIFGVVDEVVISHDEFFVVRAWAVRTIRPVEFEPLPYLLVRHALKGIERHGDLLGRERTPLTLGTQPATIRKVGLGLGHGRL